MASRDDYRDAHSEILRRCTEAGLDEREVEILLSAFEAGTLREYAPYVDKPEYGHAAYILRGFASGIRPRGWRKLLPAKQAKAVRS